MFRDATLMGEKQNKMKMKKKVEFYRARSKFCQPQCQTILRVFQNLLQQVPIELLKCERDTFFWGA